MYYILIFLLFILSCGNEHEWNEDGMWECNTNSDCVEEEGYECIMWQCLEDTHIKSVCYEQLTLPPEATCQNSSNRVLSCSVYKDKDMIIVTGGGYCVKMCEGKPCNLDTKLNVGWYERCSCGPYYYYK